MGLPLAHRSRQLSSPTDLIGCRSAPAWWTSLKRPGRSRKADTSSASPDHFVGQMLAHRLFSARVRLLDLGAPHGSGL